QTVVILTRLRSEADQFNTACQQLREQAGQLGTERVQVRDRSFAVGDLVVCGRNALQPLGVANATRGRITALDAEQRSITLALHDGTQVTLPRAYLDERPGWWTRGNPDRRTLDLAYATTGHKAQGLTVERALVRVTGAEDGNWLTVQTSRAKRETMLYAVVGPEPRTPELDEPPPPARTVAEQLTAGLRRDGAERLATDTAVQLDLRRMSTAELRAERTRLAHLLRDAPPDRARLLAHTTRLREQAEQGWGQANHQAEAARQRAADLEHGPGRLLHRGELAQAREHAALTETAAQLARGQAERAADRQRDARRGQQVHLAWREDHAEDLVAERATTRELAWQTRVAATAAELDRPAWIAELGEPPTSLRGRRAYRDATRLLSDYRDRYQVTDPDRALGPEPRGGDLEQRRAHRSCREAIERVQGKQRAERDRTDRADPGERDPDQRAQQARRERSHQRDRAGREGRERDAG
ncbi:MAG TPA: hypothetical protein VEP73_10855, partial [Actinomycetota bacterium]|nr:hypothetical protein [Actinomycetota bacterium]